MLSQTCLIFFTDARVADYPTLIGGLPAGSERLVLDVNKDSITQMQSILADYSGLNSIQIISHGAPTSNLVMNRSETCSKPIRASLSFNLL